MFDEKFYITKILSVICAPPAQPFDKKRVLTLEGANKATWKMNEAYDLDHIDVVKKRQNLAKNPLTGIYYAGIWQELGLKESDLCTEWAKSIIL